MQNCLKDLILREGVGFKPGEVFSDYRRFDVGEEVREKLAEAMGSRSFGVEVRHFSDIL
jgi:hypothetical protein